MKILPLIMEAGLHTPLGYTTSNTKNLLLRFYYGEEFFVMRRAREQVSRIQHALCEGNYIYPRNSIP